MTYFVIISNLNFNIYNIHNVMTYLWYFDSYYSHYTSQEPISIQDWERTLGVRWNEWPIKTVFLMILTKFFLAFISNNGYFYHLQFWIFNISYILIYLVINWNYHQNNHLLTICSVSYWYGFLRWKYDCLKRKLSERIKNKS